MPLTHDIRQMITDAAALQGVTANVTLADGRVVSALPGVTSVQDTLLGIDAITGTQQTLRFAAEDVPGLRAEDVLTWRGRTWTVKHILVLGNGSMVKAFLQGGAR